MKVRPVTDDLALAILRELRAIRCALERHPAPELVSALGDYFGAGAPFTAAGVLMAAEESADLADALSSAIDMNLPPSARAVSLGRLLATLPDLELVGDRRGSKLWRLRW